MNNNDYLHSDSDDNENENDGTDSNQYNNDNNNTYCIDELKQGEKYEIIITTYGGLYRYRLGDVVEVVGFYHKSPQISFLYRKNQILKSIMNFIKKCKVNIIDYTTMPDNSITPGRYIVYIEFKENISSKDIANFERVLDNELQNANLAYGRFRKSRRLDRLKVISLEKVTFELVKEKLFSKGISKNQVKIPRVLINKKNILDIIVSRYNKVI